MPVEWIRDDAVYFNMHRFTGLRPHTAPTDVYDIFFREFERAYEEGGLFLLTMHPHVTGYRSRIWILEKLLAEITQSAGRVGGHSRGNRRLRQSGVRPREDSLRAHAIVGLGCGVLPAGEPQQHRRCAGRSRRPPHDCRGRHPHGRDGHFAAIARIVFGTSPLRPPMC